MFGLPAAIKQRKAGADRRESDWWEAASERGSRGLYV